MVYKVLNGGTTDYLGQVVTDEKDLLQKIVDTLLLTDTPWVIDNQIIASNFFTAEGITSNSHNCYYKLTGNPGGGTIDCEMSKDNLYTTLSSIFSVPYDTG